ncbi:uncharacterized protein LOC125236934 [Leguminivora glycinivorella]|uniref:uncharacterized protein LOC125236934 n=1 Tax=Leguminivora glycinivorella TaxID=1035111 RepID=UPI00200E0419|nr:uncharacterized protein LOC125236934 [Leguminivora glycinivorella]
MSVLQCGDLMFLQLNNNQISSLPEDFDINTLQVLEMIDMRDNPICELEHPKHMLIRYADVSTPSSLSEIASASGSGATLPLWPSTPLPCAYLLYQAQEAEMELDASSVDSSEDWENSVNSSELDVQYQSDEERADNEVRLS